MHTLMRTYIHTFTQTYIQTYKQGKTSIPSRTVNVCGALLLRKGKHSSKVSKNHWFFSLLGITAGVSNPNNNAEGCITG